MKILVTGGTGSMGRTLVRRLLERDSSYEVVVFSRDEAKQFDMQQEYRKEPRVSFYLGDVRRYDDVFGAMIDCTTVIHAAALKQVPICEYSPEQALLTNCLGMENVAKAAKAHRVASVVTVSTDKACKPTTAMGMTKALQEKIWIAANIDSHTRFTGVRYGNVISSRGSVVPLFQKQIAAGGPVTITDPGMTRFLLTLDYAADLVFAATNARAGEIVVPRAPSARVDQIAKALMGSRSISMGIIGRRPGEKLHEIMVSAEESVHTVQRGEYFVITPELLGEGWTDSELPFLGREYSSADSVLTDEGVAALLKDYACV